MRTIFPAGLITFVILLSAATCKNSSSEASPTTTTTNTEREVNASGEHFVVYQGGLQNKFEDWGWAARDLKPGVPARLDVKNYSGWIIARRDFNYDVAAFRFKLKADPSLGDFLGVKLANDVGTEFPEIAVTRAHRKTLPDGWEDIELPMHELMPTAASFDRVTIRARKGLPSTWIEIDDIAFVCVGACRAVDEAPADGGPKHPLARAKKTLTGDVVVQCLAPSKQISPGIYGIAYDARLDKGDSRYLWTLNATGRRFGGNPTSRYNWKLGNAWNTAEDWFFRNVDYRGEKSPAWRDFAVENHRRGVATAMTMPMLGYVAKDTSSFSYPVSVFGPQQATDPSSVDAGNGKRQDGSHINGASPLRTSIAHDEKFVEAWVKEIVAQNANENTRLVDLYLLDNEPMLWSSTHRDVHPNPTTYDELLAKTVATGSAIRRADPSARIAGPGLWGWPAYFFSALDKDKGFFLKPDRRAHDDKPLLEWLLAKLKAHETKTGVKVMDAVDVHFYPPNVYNDKSDLSTAELRVRSTRSFWDPTYVDETWIKEPVRLIPRMKEIIEKNYPGLGLVIGEYSLGGERHISGGLAVAEVLGRFGDLGVDDAYYWTYPPEGSPAYWAFRAYRNYDGKGAAFLDDGIPVTSPAGVSAFGSRSADKTRTVSVLVNLEASTAYDAKILGDGCGEIASVRAFVFYDGALALTEANAMVDVDGVRLMVPPYSFVVVELTHK